MTTFITQDRQDAERELVNRTPLTNQRIREIMKQCTFTDYTLDEEEPFEQFDYHEFARAIERAHGIGE